MCYHNPLYNFVQPAIDELVNYIDDLIDALGRSVTDENSRRHEAKQSGDLAEPFEICHFTLEVLMRTEIGQCIDSFWPNDHQYYAGAVTTVSDDRMCAVTIG